MNDVYTITLRRRSIPTPASGTALRSPATPASVVGRWSAVGAAWRSVEMTRGLLVAIALMIVVIGCQTTPKVSSLPDPIFPPPTEVRTPTTQLTDARDRTFEAEKSANVTRERVGLISPEKFSATKQNAIESADETARLVRKILDPILEAIAIDAVAKSQVTELQGQVTYWQNRLIESERIRGELIKAHEIELKGEKEKTARAQAWFPKFVAGLNAILGLVLFIVSLFALKIPSWRVAGISFFGSSFATGSAWAAYYHSAKLGTVGLVAAGVLTAGVVAFAFYLLIRSRTSIINSLETAKGIGEVKLSEKAKGMLIMGQSHTAIAAVKQVKKRNAKKAATVNK